MATVLSMSASRIVAGEFDTQKRYLRSLVSGADIPIAQGVTFFIVAATGLTTHWRYSVNGYVMTFGGTASGDAASTLVKV